MYFCITKVMFDSEGVTDRDAKELSALVEKVRTRFKVCVKTADEFRRDGLPGLVIASLSSSEEKLSKQIDSIVQFCEESGFGRVASENSLFDHLDSFEEFT